jgi:hypothetical protein
MSQVLQMVITVTVITSIIIENIGLEHTISTSRASLAPKPTIFLSHFLKVLDKKREKLGKA